MARKKSNKNQRSKQAKKAVKALSKLNPVVLVIVLVLVISIAFGTYMYETNGDFRDFVDVNIFGKEPTADIGDEALTISLIDVGNKYNSDCVYIKVGSTDILVDSAGKFDKKTSNDNIEAYLKSKMTDTLLDYVIVTHADADHIGGFAGDATVTSLFERFKCGTIIDFPRTNKDTATYDRYIENRDAEVRDDGAVHYTALQCYLGQDGASPTYDLSNGATLEILYNYYYENNSSNENNYSVCFRIKHGDKQFLFTGDLEEEGEFKFATKYADIGQVDFFKAGHHGSKTSNNIELLEVIRPKIVGISCVAGHNEFDSAPENIFPTQTAIHNIAKYTQEVYVTACYVDEEYAPLNGTIVVISDQEGVRVDCVVSDDVLARSEWFRDTVSDSTTQKTCPTEWLDLMSA
ncbi:MAG: hypothetical protein J6Q52_04510 [Clostridia bacterium]|nr:hypothetical protein [Clostridia bacterium]